MHRLRQSFPSASWASEHGLRRVALGIAVVVWMTALSCVVAAGAPMSETDREQARRLVKLGDARFAAGDFDGAYHAYHGADLIMGVPTTGLQLARAELALGKLIESRRTLKRVKAFPKEQGEPEAYVDAREAAAKLEDDVALRIPSVTIRIAGVPAGKRAWVSVDGNHLSAQEVGKPHPLNPGNHEIAAGGEGLQERAQGIVLAEGEHKILELDLALQPPEAPPERAPLVVSPLVWVGFALAGAGTIVGAVTGGVSLSLASEVREVCFEGRICPRSAEDKRDRSLALAHTSTASFAVAGIGSLLGIIGFVISGRDGPATVTVRVAPSSATLVLGTSF